MTESTLIKTDTLILGGGVSGLTLAHDFQKARRDFILIEKSDEPGGCAQTIQEDGFLFEKGPFNLLVRDPAFEDLLSDLEDRLTVVPPDPAAKRRDLVLEGRLEKVPGSLWEAAKTPLLSPWQKMRILLEPVLGKGSNQEDPTLGELFRRRFGDAFADRVLSAVVVGIFAGDSDRLSAKSCFRFFWEIDRDSRSFLIGGLRRRLRSRMNTRRWKGMVSFDGGVGAFSDALAAPLGDRLRLGVEATSIEQSDSGYLVHSQDQRRKFWTFGAKNLVIGLDLPAARRMLRPVAPDIASELDPIQSASLAVVNLGFSPGSLPEPPKGFGFLVPRTECDQVKILGALWASSAFPHHAPPGGQTVRVFVGGDRSPDWLKWGDQDLADRAIDQLSRFLPMTRPPEIVRISRYMESIPQMVPGHSALIERVENLLGKRPDLHLVGNYLHGVSINDCVCHARKTAERILAEN